MQDVFPLHTCPRCGNTLEAGFASRSSGLSFIAPDKFARFMFLDEDVSKAGFRKLFPWKAEYNRAYRCQTCKLYLRDYGVIYSRHEAETIAVSLLDKNIQTE